MKQKKCKKCHKWFEQFTIGKGKSRLCRKCSSNAPLLTKEILEKMYCKEEKTSRDIAKHFNLSKDSILYQMKKLGIKRRTVSEAMKLYWRENDTN